MWIGLEGRRRQGDLPVTVGVHFHTVANALVYTSEDAVREREYSNKLTEIGQDLINEILMQMECWSIDVRERDGGFVRCENLRNAYWIRIEGL